MQEKPQFAFISVGKLYLGSASQKPDIHRSEFAAEVTRRHDKSLQKNDWKSPSADKGMSYNLWNQGYQETRDPVQIVSVVPDESGDRLYYLLTTDSVGGLFCYDLKEKSERRIFHKEHFVASGLSGGGDGRGLLCSVGAGEASHIALLSTERYRVEEITEGDSQDSAPSWDPRHPRAIVYQSAGIGRNNQGYFVGLGPSSIEWVNLDNGMVETLLEDEHYDYLKPTIVSDGSIYCIRRPYHRSAYVSTWESIVEFFKIPYRLLKALFGFLSIITQIFGKEDLIKTSSGERQKVDAREVFIKGQLLEMQRNRKDDADAIIPKNWELIRFSPDGSSEVIEQGVADYMINPDGGILYSKGYSIWTRKDRESSRLYRGKEIIESVISL